jgi:hypothetical protein
MENIQPVVNPNPDQVPAITPPEQVVVTPGEVTSNPAPQPGDKTPNALLLESLQEERDKRRQLEEELESLRSPAPSETGEVFSDEGKAIVDKYVAPLQDTVTSLQDQLAIKDVQATYPQLKELSSEFDEYRKDYPRHKIDNVAKLFLTEKGLLDAPRKGLEATTGGPRVPLTSGMTAADVETLRKTDFKKYQQMVMNDQIKIEG